MPKKKKVFNIQLDIGQANLMADLGKKIGPEGLPNRQIAVEFTDLVKKAGLSGNKKITMILTVFPDKKYTIAIHQNENTSTLILAELGLKSGSKAPGHGAAIANITLQQLDNVATKKMVDLGMENDTTSPMFLKNLNRARRIIAGTARSMGITCPELAAMIGEENANN